MCYSAFLSFNGRTADIAHLPVSYMYRKKTCEMTFRMEERYDMNLPYILCSTVFT